MAVRRTLEVMVCAFVGVGTVAGQGCSNAPSADDTTCRCSPGNVARAALPDGSHLDGPALLGMLRRHRQDVEAGRNPRDIKVADDQLRLAVIDYCQPCGDWVKDRSTVEEMFPLDKLDDAADAVCLGLVLRNGKTLYGATRPKSCR